MTVSLGIDILLKGQTRLLKGKRVALLTHGAGVDSHLHATRSLFYNHGAIDLTLLFAPEHGLYGIAQDMEGVLTERDRETGLDVVSLYGRSATSLKPKVRDLDRFDCLVCDLQDVGSRYYTFIYTMALCMKACAEAGKRVIVLDRPNPINGVDVEGPLLKRQFASFVGLYPLPVRHGMTIGELALYFNETEGFGCDLTVMPMKGWRRTMYFDETGLCWIPPSPNMPHLNTAILYPGLCLIEATQLSEGRGTTKPFEWVGAPFIEAHKLAVHLNALGLKGAVFSPVSFRPGYQKHQGQVCHGVQIHVTDRSLFKPYETGLRLIDALYKLYPDSFKWREKAYEFVKDIPAIDLLTGDAYFMGIVGECGGLDKYIKCCAKESRDFFKKRKKYLLY
ncbi:MAG: DUF1343 domain-containing protein [Deltaproteobacteria bacterium]|nr:DUF1343 domain-containing protein [Deltaproteobacteria bacterium]